MSAAPVRQVSSLFKIGRWSALAVGLSYGFLHARTLRNEASERRIEHEYARKVALIEEAKKKYAESKSPKGESGSEQFNFDDPSFDADKWAKHLEAKFN
ncbi:hypothetical protein GGI02_003755 [Coemansia sp. RSA 2322]|uniref:ATP synthase F(0) complex subunit e, mitochondrial n=1 Tax=Coemansia thaxteri TaxID=2663907 RepID=A0A9W8BJ02_9FUNG|nr:hypothetical protein H4R26_003398 [Coemansia thaxteri]KAJ2468278.1 hypothetical protein GGI02_003755 [Coemansia sp. RSA 2322]KAJ2486152.1 hypothetical protein EV174_001305 [Coemansia sp. RSA 2320]